VQELFDVVNDFPHITEAARKSFNTLKTNMSKLKMSSTSAENAIKKLKEEEDNAMNMKKSANINTLSIFLDEAKEKLTTVNSDFTTMETKFKALCKYLGEEETGTELVEMFGVLSKFIQSLKGAIIRIEDMERRKESAKRREMEKERSSSSMGRTSSIGGGRGGGGTPRASSVKKIGGMTMGTANNFASNRTNSNSVSSAISSSGESANSGSNSGASSSNNNNNNSDSKKGRRGKRRE